jgi:MoaA/NifB/PqqE/SkfB family radical SAM enzyme
MKELTIEITDRCSLNCLFCSTQAGKSGEIFVSPKRITEILNEYPEFKRVRLSGGEPFEHPHLEEIVETIFNSGRECQLLSCGVKQDKDIPEKSFTRIAGLVKDIVFSYHGFYTDHERIVKPKTPFHKTLPYWDFMMDSVEHAYYSDIPVSFQTVVINQNYGQLESMAKTIAGLKRAMPKFGEWHLLRFVPQGRGSKNKDQEPNNEETKHLVDLVENWKHVYPYLKISYTHAFDMKECDCGSEKAVVTVNGEEIPCSALKYGAKSECKFPCLKR